MFVPSNDRATAADTMSKYVVYFATALAGLAPAAGCTVPPAIVSTVEEDASRRYRERLAEIDHLTKLGQVRRAIKRVELALIDHYHSEELRDRLAGLRSMRQVMFTGDMRDAREKVEAGQPRTALAILEAVERYGDDEMIATARLESGKVVEAHPAVFGPSQE